MATPVHMLSATEIMSTSAVGVEVAGTVLGKRSRERYEIYRIALHGLMTTKAIVMKSQPHTGSWKQWGPRRGLAVHLPTGPNKKSMINPRRWDAERGGSHPRQHRKFTIDSCWGLVSRRGRWEPLRRDSRPGQRRESRRKRRTT